jgi:hypothetical protein
MALKQFTVPEDIVVRSEGSVVKMSIDFEAKVVQ